MSFRKQWRFSHVTIRYQFRWQITQLGWGLLSVFQLDIIIDGSLESLFFLDPQLIDPPLSLAYPFTFLPHLFQGLYKKTHCQSIFTLKIEICIFLKVCLLRWCSGYEGAWVPWCPSGTKAFYLCSLSVGLFWIIDNKKYWTQSLKIQAVEHFLL